MVAVKFFAGFREKIGEEEISIDIADTTLEGLIDLLDEKHPGIKELITGHGATIAVNRKVATLNDTVKNSDEVAIFPPVSGG
ncbi:MAG: MoaD/ThiS family protein [Candidatus Hydrothermarchaeaceae archaeon]